MSKNKYFENGFIFFSKSQHKRKIQQYQIFTACLYTRNKMKKKQRKNKAVNSSNKKTNQH